MTRLLIPLSVPDVSSFAKRLRAQLDEREGADNTPTHLELLHMLARATGLRNYQTLRAAATQAPPDAAPASPQPAALASATSHNESAVAELSATARKALLQFDAQGRLVRLPTKLSVQRMVSWALWTQFDAKRRYTEKEVNRILNAHHTFGDPATLRRELVNMKLMGRKSDCSAYWKEPQRPDAEVRAFLHAWRARWRAAAGASG
jgi:hypothetical protein